MSTEISVLSGAAFQRSLTLAAAAFREKTGHTVRVTSNLDENVNRRLKDGEAFDLVLSSDDSLEKNYRPIGLVEAGGISVGRAGIGVTVRAGAPLPDISSVEALGRAALEAESILITRHTSGLYIETMLGKMGIYQRVEGKLIRFPNGPELGERLLAGGGREFGFLPIAHIRVNDEKGLVLVGPLPEAVQYFREYIAVPTTGSANKEAAWEFARFCGGPAKSFFAMSGFI